MLKPRPPAPPAQGNTDPQSGEPVRTTPDVDNQPEGTPGEASPGDEPFPAAGERTDPRQQ